MIVVCPFFLAIFGWGGSGVWTVLLLGFGVVVGIKVLGYRVWSLGVGFFLGLRREVWGFEVP